METVRIIIMVIIVASISGSLGFLIGALCRVSRKADEENEQLK